jgi:hypothetical protein
LPEANRAEGNVGEARAAARRTPSPSNNQVTQYPSNQVKKGAAWVGVLGAGFCRDLEHYSSFAPNARRARREDIYSYI